MQSYLRAIGETPLLDADEERALARRIQAGDAGARDRLVRANLRLVVAIARSYTGRGLILEDLIAEGNVGLLYAVDGFDPSMNTRFSVYASYWIRQAIRRALVSAGKAVRLPDRVAGLLIKWRGEAIRMRGELGREPAPEEVAGRLGLPARKLRAVQKALRVSEPVPQEQADGSGPPLESLAQDSSVGPDAGVMEAEELRQAVGLLARLGGREAAVLRMRFGLDGDGPRTLREIGEHLGLTRERVRQIEGEALRDLRQRLEAG